MFLFCVEGTCRVVGIASEGLVAEGLFVCSNDILVFCVLFVVFESCFVFQVANGMTCGSTVFLCVLRCDISNAHVFHCVPQLHLQNVKKEPVEASLALHPTT